jgi:hypothetical protein
VLPCVCNTFSPTVERWMDRRSVGFRADVNPPAIHTLSDHRGTIRNVCRPICFSDGLRSVRPGCGGSPPSFSEHADYLWGIVDARNTNQRTWSLSAVGTLFCGDAEAAAGAGWVGRSSCGHG